jgi:hypothetical protein
MTSQDVYGCPDYVFVPIERVDHRITEELIYWGVMIIPGMERRVY